MKMAIYHCSISNVSRAKDSSSCATLSYISAEKIYEERTAKVYSYGRKERVLDVGTIIPEYAPLEFQNPEILFNSIENYEKAENARTAKKVEVALPREFDIEKQKEVIKEYIKGNLTKEGYCATYAIHNDKENNNPHAHILVANRRINERGEWSSKRKMVYVLDAFGERVPRLDENGVQKTDSRGRKQWVRMNAEQNPLDKKEFLQNLRKGWADVCNRYLGYDQQIDHRSYAARGIEQIPTIHEGYAGREIENRGDISDRVEQNREIRKKNIVLESMQSEIKELSEKLQEIIRGLYDRYSETIRDIRGAGHSHSGAEQRMYEVERNLQGTGERSENLEWKAQEITRICQRGIREAKFRTRTNQSELREIKYRERAAQSGERRAEQRKYMASQRTVAFDAVKAPYNDFKKNNDVKLGDKEKTPQNSLESVKKGIYTSSHVEDIPKVKKDPTTVSITLQNVLKKCQEETSDIYRMSEGELMWGTKLALQMECEKEGLSDYIFFSDKDYDLQCRKEVLDLFDMSLLPAKGQKQAVKKKELYPRL